VAKCIVMTAGYIASCCAVSLEVAVMQWQSGRLHGATINTAVDTIDGTHCMCPPESVRTQLHCPEHTSDGTHAFVTRTGMPQMIDVLVDASVRVGPALWVVTRCDSASCSMLQL
jgi:hypothetical protein